MVFIMTTPAAFNPPEHPEHEIFIERCDDRFISRPSRRAKIHEYSLFSTNPKPFGIPPYRLTIPRKRHCVSRAFDRPLLNRFQFFLAWIVRHVFLSGKEATYSGAAIPCDISYRVSRARPGHKSRCGARGSSLRRGTYRMIGGAL